MRRYHCIPASPVLAIVASIIFLLLSSSNAATFRTLIAKVEQVSDGDTLVAFTANGTKLRIRLLGIDAPELPHGNEPGQAFGEKAQDYLDHLIGGRTVRVDTYGPDFYGKRVLAVIWNGQVNVNLLPVATGHAETHRGAPLQVCCRELEE
jgi:endonuclease YncB( thermonuclease family)